MRTLKASLTSQKCHLGRQSTWVGIVFGSDDGQARVRLLVSHRQLTPGVGKLAKRSRRQSLQVHPPLRSEHGHFHDHGQPCGYPP